MPFGLDPDVHFSCEIGKTFSSAEAVNVIREHSSIKKVL